MVIPCKIFFVHDDHTAEYKETVKESKKNKSTGITSDVLLGAVYIYTAKAGGRPSTKVGKEITLTVAQIATLLEDGGIKIIK